MSSPTVSPPRATPAAAPKRPRPWTLWSFRLVVTVFTVQVFAQAALAGGFLSGHYGALTTHELNGLALAGTGWLLPVAAVLAWRPGRFPAWPILASLVTYAAVLVQLILGFSRALAVHVPLGVLLVVALAFLCRWAWSPTGSTTTAEPPERVRP